MENNEVRMDRFTWEPGDLKIIRPAPKKNEKTQAAKKAEKAEKKKTDK